MKGNDTDFVKSLRHENYLLINVTILLKEAISKHFA